MTDAVSSNINTKIEAVVKNVSINNGAIFTKPVEFESLKLSFCIAADLNYINQFRSYIVDIYDFTITATGNNLIFTVKNGVYEYSVSKQVDISDASPEWLKVELLVNTKKSTVELALDGKYQLKGFNYILPKAVLEHNPNHSLVHATNTYISNLSLHVKERKKKG
jgi:hypothetical protein